MVSRNNSVSIRVDRIFFDSMFEPERKKLQAKLGIEMTQPRFTAYLAKSGAFIKYPKNNSFMPKLGRKTRSYRFSV